MFVYAYVHVCIYIYIRVYADNICEYDVLLYSHCYFFSLGSNKISVRKNEKKCVVVIFKVNKMFDHFFESDVMKIFILKRLSRNSGVYSMQRR